MLGWRKLLLQEELVKWLNLKLEEQGRMVIPMEDVGAKELEDASRSLPLEDLTEQEERLAIRTYEMKDLG